MLRIAVLIALVLVAAPARAEPPDGFPTPPLAVIEQLQHRHHHKDWLRVTSDSTRWELRARRIDEEGLGGLAVRGSTRVAPERIPWSSISRIDQRESHARFGQLAGVVLGALIGTAGGAKGAAAGAVVGAWLGGRVGHAIVNERLLYLAPVTPQVVLAAPAEAQASPVAASPAVAVGSVVAPARAHASDASTVWLTSQAAMSQPVGDFHPAGPSNGWGYEVQSSFAPAHGSIGARLDFGTASYRSHHDGLSADVFGNGSEVSLLGVSTGTDLYWVMVGPQWGLHARHSGPYLFATVGFVHVAPKGNAAWGQYLVYDMPGLPAGSTGFASSVGGGLRLALGKSKNLAITTELDYQRGGVKDYIAAPGVEGSYPNTRFSSRKGQLETVTFRAGLARPWGRG